MLAFEEPKVYGEFMSCFRLLKRPPWEFVWVPGLWGRLGAVPGREFYVPVG